MEYYISIFEDGVRTDLAPASDLSSLTKSFTKKNGYMDDLEADGYMFVRLQAVMQHTDGREIVVEVQVA